MVARRAVIAADWVATVSGFAKVFIDDAGRLTKDTINKANKMASFAGLKIYVSCRHCG